VFTVALSAVYTTAHGTQCHISKKGEDMRTLFLSILLASASALAVRADNVSLSGKWKIHINVQGNESDAVCGFTQKDDGLSGSCATENGEKPLAGKVDGQKITWSYDSEYEGTPLTVKFSGTIDSAATKLAGSVSVEQFGADGDFTGVPSK
jgi:hypothetical protein